MNRKRQRTLVSDMVSKRCTTMDRRRQTLWPWKLKPMLYGGDGQWPGSCRRRAWRHSPIYGSKSPIRTGVMRPWNLIPFGPKLCSTNQVGPHRGCCRASLCAREGFCSKLFPGSLAVAGPLQREPTTQPKQSRGNSQSGRNP